LDEPTNGLDPQGIADMRNLVLQLSKEMGKTILLSSHLLSEIELIANRMLIIHKGKKIAEGTVAELLDPANTLVQLETTDNNAALQKLENTVWSGKAHPGKGFIQCSIGRNQIPELVASLTAMGVGIVAVKPRHSLEEYFLSLTNNDADA
jgi:ABC-type multidrug transport system ATPase subunit